MTELEKVLSNKYINMSRAVLDIAREVKMDETRLIPYVWLKVIVIKFKNSLIQIWETQT